MAKLFRFLAVIALIAGGVFAFNLWRKNVAQQEQEEWLQAVKDAHTETPVTLQ